MAKIDYMAKAALTKLIELINQTFAGKADVSHSHTEYALTSHSHTEYAASGHSHSQATSLAAGFMSATDKSKLDGISNSANYTVVDSGLSSSSSNPLQNKAIYSALAGKANTTHSHTEYAASGHSHSQATSSAAGFMSANDKSKLDGISSSANCTVVDSGLSSSSSNPLQNKAIYNALAKYLPLAGGTVTGDIILQGDKHIKGNANNYGILGASNCYLCQAYVTGYYGKSMTLDTEIKAPKLTLNGTSYTKKLYDADSVKIQSTNITANSTSLTTGNIVMVYE